MTEIPPCGNIEQYQLLKRFSPLSPPDRLTMLLV